MKYVVSKVFLFAILACGLAYTAHVALDDEADTDTRLIYAVCTFAITALSGLVLLYSMRQPVYEAVDKLQAQIEQMRSESPPAEPSLRVCYDSMLESAQRNYEAAVAKVKHRRWGYAYHCANMGLQNIKDFHKAEAASQAAPREL